MAKIFKYTSGRAVMVLKKFIVLLKVANVLKNKTKQNKTEKFRFGMLHRSQFNDENILLRR